MARALLTLLLATVLLPAAAAKQLLISKHRIRAAAGASADVPLPAESQAFLRTSTRVHSASAILVGKDQAGLFIEVPPTLPPGRYSVAFSVADAAGQERTGSIEVTVDPLPPARQTGPPPVILLNGYQFLSLPGTCSPDRDSSQTFGLLQQYLQADGRFVFFLDSCTLGGGAAPPVEDLGNNLGMFIQNWRYTDGSPVSQVDLITHSMGGLIARCYLSGKQRAPGVFLPPPDPKVRKLVLVACPNFGSGWASATDVFGAGNQLPSMRLGSQFLWDLATWNQGFDDLREVDTIAVIGNGGSEGKGDGIVSMMSASLLFNPRSFFSSVVNTRVVPYCHTSAAASLACSTNELIAGVDSPAHLTSRIARSFLSGSNEWQSTGASPFTIPLLSSNGGIYAEYKDASDLSFTDISQVQVSTGTSTLAQLIQGPDSTVFYSEYVPSRFQPYNLLDLLRGQWYQLSAKIQPARFVAVLGKFLPVISRVQPAAGVGDTLTLAPGSLISLFGGGLAASSGQAQSLPLPTRLADTTVLANSQALGLLYASDQQINAYLPGNLTGAVTITVSNSKGTHSRRVMMSPAAPALFSLDGSGTGPAAALLHVRAGQLGQPGERGRIRLAFRYRPGG
ncbi:MAG TPA: hypothetical protein VEU62_11030 [Bryobacterales bacterium]|nr:hypothetical protein [Bryobacterales bacterium]